MGWLTDQIRERKRMDKIQQIDVAKIIPTKDNPRVIRKDDPKTKELADSIREHGLLEPILCRPHPDKPGFYDLRAGERRWLAHKLIGAETILTIVRDWDDRQALNVTIVENLQREDLTPMEEARGVRKLLDDHQDIKVIAAKIGKSPQWVVRRAKLSDLIPEIVRAVEDPKSWFRAASVAHLELICRFDVETQKRIVSALNSRHWMLDSGNFREFEREIASLTLELKRSPWKLDDATLDPKAGACLTCQKRSSRHPGLFDDEMDPKALEAVDKCLDKECHLRKLAEHTARQEAKLRAEHPNLMRITTAPIPYHMRQSDEMKGVLEVDGYKVKKASKKTPGSKPALVVAGPGAGTLNWVTLGREPTTKTGRKADPVTGEAKPLSMKEKQAGLLMRRKAWVCNHVAERLAGTSLKKPAEPFFVDVPPFETILILAAAFGSAHRASSVGEMEWKHLADYRVTPEKGKDELWKDVAAVLRERLKFYTTSTCDGHYKEALRIAEILQMPPEKELLESAAVEIPEPKAWSKKAAGAAGA